MNTYLEHVKCICIVYFPKIIMQLAAGFNGNINNAQTGTTLIRKLTISKYLPVHFPALD